MRIYPGTTVDYEFATLGGLGYTGTLNDRQFAALRAEGLTGSLPDMFGQFDGTLGGGVSGFIVNVPSGKVIMKITSSTNITSTNGVTLISASGCTWRLSLNRPTATSRTPGAGWSPLAMAQRSRRLGGDSAARR